MSARLAWLGVLGLVWLALAAAPVRAFTIVATYDTSITNHPQAATIEATINDVIADYEARIADPVTVTITFRTMTAGLGESYCAGGGVAYTTFLDALRAHATSADDAIALSHLPIGPNNPVNFNADIGVKRPLARVLGLTLTTPPGPLGAASALRVGVLNPRPDPSHAGTGLKSVMPPTSVNSPNAALVDPYSTDGLIRLNVGIMNLSPQQANPLLYSLRSTTFHEIDEVLGFDSVLNNLANGATLPAGPVAPHDLFRFDANGNRSYSTSLSAAAYFSLDGTTLLARFNQEAGNDFSDWYSPGYQVDQVQDAKQSKGVHPEMGVEWRCLDVIGYSYGPQGVWVDFNYGGGTQTGDFATPFHTLAQGVSAVPVGGTILIKGNGASLERPTITKAMMILSVGGVATIGQ